MLVLLLIGENGFVLMFYRDVRWGNMYESVCIFYDIRDIWGLYLVLVKRKKKRKGGGNDVLRWLF